MRSRSNGGVIGGYALPNQNRANGVFFIHDAAIFNTGASPIWPLGTGYIYSASGGTITTAVDNANYKLHTFTANGTFTVATGSAYLEILLVGGGGAGGSANGQSTTAYDIASAGGGAGGAVVLVSQAFVQPGTTFTVEVGQGGAATPALSTVSDALNSGKPSKVTSTSGHNYNAPGGAMGETIHNGSVYAGSGGGGGRAAYGGASSGGPSAARGAGGGSPGIVVTSSQSGGTGIGSEVSGTGLPASAGGGGAGYTFGYNGQYDFDLEKSGNGGEAYQWSRTGLYYGGGGPGGQTYDFPIGTSHLNGSGQYASGTRYAKAWAYNNQYSRNDGGSATSGYGTGGGGGAFGMRTLATNLGGTGGAGSSGTVIFCYRYR